MSVSSADTHYENFPVASIFCPKKLRPAVTAFYWFARTADDLADEGVATFERRLLDLQDYRADLIRAVQAKSTSLRWRTLFDHLARHCCSGKDFPSQHLHALLDAFEKDVRDREAGYQYTSRTQLLAYCQLSANPVGRVMLHLFGVDDDLSKAQSDAICSALQLINFWQDVSIDVPQGRCYWPRFDAASLRSLCVWARALMMQGSPLCKRLAKLSSWRLGFELRLVVQGGLCILDKIEAQGFDTSTQRPVLTLHDSPRIVWRALLM